MRSITSSHVLLTGALAAAIAGLAGCDVEKKRDGDVTLPKYEVQKTQEGNVTLPKYDVTPPSLSVGASQAEVTVPKVTTEKKTIEVPTIDVKSGAERKVDAQMAPASQPQR